LAGRRLFAIVERLDGLDGLDDVLVKPFVRDGPLIALDTGVLPGLPGWMCRIDPPRVSADSSSLPGRRCEALPRGSLPLKYSGPLSIAWQLIAWQSMIRDANGAWSATPFDE
jgi:hypothetical protein